jgi:hypothetical protein
MDQVLIGLVGVIVLTNAAYTVWSYFSLRSFLSDKRVQKMEDKYVIEQIIHIRSSLNVIYAGTAIVTFILAFFGFNLQNNITKEVTREISTAAKVDLNVLKMKADSISVLDSLSRQSNTEIRRYREVARLMSESMKQTTQRLFVIEALPISGRKNRYDYSELRPVDGSIIPKLSRPPVVIVKVYDKDNRMGYGADTEVGPDNIKIEIGSPEQVYADIWIYVK